MLFSKQQSYFSATSLAVGLLVLTILFSCQSENKKETVQNSKSETEKAEKATVKPDLPSIDKFNTRVAYVPSIGEGTISAIDLNSNKIKWTLKVSEGNKDRKAESAMGIAATKDGKYVFTGDVAAKEAVIVDADQQEIIKRIPLSHGIHAIDICPHGHWVWVTGRLKNYPWLTATTVIDVQKQKKVATMSPAMGGSAHLAWTPDAKEVWAASVSTNTVWVWDAIKREVTDVIPLIYKDLESESPEAQYGLIGVNEITISPDGKTAYAVGPEAGVVFAIDVNEKKLIKAVKVGERTHGIAVSRDGKEVWTANNTGTVSILDASSLELLHEIDLREYADELPYSHVAFSLDGKKAYVSITRDVAVIDVAERTVETTIPFGYGTHEISLEDFFVEFEGEIKRVEGTTTLKSSSKDNEQNETKVSNEAGIEVKVTPQIKEKEVSFSIKINTHSGDLMEHDLVGQSELTINDNVHPDLKWVAESESSHHRKGSLKTNYGKEIQSISLVVKDIGIPFRKFEWNNL